MSDTSELATQIHRLDTVLGKVADTALQNTCGFGLSQYKILWMLKTHREGVLQTTIAKWLNLTEAAVSRQMRVLENDGLIDRQTDPENRRNNNITLTIKGKKLAATAKHLLIEEYEPHFAVVTARERTELNRLLEKIFYSVVKKIEKEGQ